MCYNILWVVTIAVSFIYRYHIIENSFTSLKTLLIPYSTFTLSPRTLKAAKLFTRLDSCLFQNVIQMKPYICKFFTLTSSLKNLHLPTYFHPYIFLTWKLMLLKSMNHIPLYGCTTVCLPVHLLKEIWAASRFGYYE